MLELAVGRNGSDHPTRRPRRPAHRHVVFLQDRAAPAGYSIGMHATGTFEISAQHEPPFDERDGVSLSHSTFEKRFSGPLTATSTVHMIAARTATAGSAGYVAVERIAGTLDGRAGSFVVLHRGLMSRGAPALTIEIVPDSGSGELAGIAGTMTITIVDGQHHYAIDYTLEPR
jgi:hypothetical protein